MESFCTDCFSKKNIFFEKRYSNIHKRLQACNGNLYKHINTEIQSYKHSSKNMSITKGFFFSYEHGLIQNSGYFKSLYQIERSLIHLFIFLIYISNIYHNQERNRISPLLKDHKDKGWMITAHATGDSVLGRGSRGLEESELVSSLFDGSGKRESMDPTRMAWRRRNGSRCGS